MNFTDSKKLSVRKLCKGLKQIGGEDIVFEDGISLETWCYDRLFIILGFFKSIKAFHKRLEKDNSYVETYINYYPKEKRISLEILNAGGDGTQDEIEILGKAKDFLIEHFEHWCEDYKHATPLELIQEVV